MSGDLFQCGYGAIVREDVEALEACLAAVIADKQLLVGSTLAVSASVLPKPVVRVLEIGMHDGGTARGIERFLAERGCDLEYIGIDPDDGTTRPRYVPIGGRVIVGDSAEVFAQVPGGLDLVWCDGCHCQNHVILEVIHYARKVRRGGFLCFHDVNPRCEGPGFHQYHGPDWTEFGIAVNAALVAICFPWEGWEFFEEKIPTDRVDCGTRAYRRTA